MGELRAVAVGVLVYFLSACGAPTEPKWAGDPEALVPELCGDVPKVDAGALPSEAVELRTKGMKALRDGDFVVASELFGEAIDLAPSNVGLVALHAVANDRLRVSAKEKGEEYDKQRPVKLEPPTDEPPTAPPVDPISVREIGKVRFEEKDDLRAAGGMFRREQLPPVLRRVYSLRSFAVHEDRGVVIYARNQRYLVLQVGPDGASPPLHIADYAKLVDKEGRKPVAVHSATFSDDAIYAVMTVDGGMWIYAHDRDTGKLLWRLAANGVRTIAVVGDHLVGLMHKQLLVLDRRTGGERARHTTRQWPRQLVVRDGYIFAVARDEAEVFELGAGRGAQIQHADSLADFIRRVSGTDDVSPPNVFASAPAAAVEIAPEHQCAVTHALAELDAGQYEAAAARLTRMERFYPHHPVVLALTATSRYMRRHAREQMDLSEAHVRAFSPLEEPDASRDVESGASLVQVSTRPAENLSRWATRHGVSRYSIDPDDLPTEIPRHYGRHEISEWVGDAEGGHVIIYGRRYVVLARDGKVEAAFDGKTLFGAKHDLNAFNPGVNLGLLHLATRRGDQLFISFTDSMSRRGLASIDISTGRMRWRSATTFVATQFVVAQDHVVAAYGRNVHILRASDGAVIGTSLLRDTLRAMAVAGEKILVNSFSGSDAYAITHKGG